MKNDDNGCIKSESAQLQKFSLKAVQQMELPPHSGETEKYVDWYESTERHFGCAAAEPLLKDVALVRSALIFLTLQSV